MRISIMQPYFFPYRGYFNMIESVDLFVTLTDVQYIRRGWINRNRIKSSAGQQWINIPINKCDRSTNITDVTICNNIKWRQKHISQIISAYGRSPFLTDYEELLEQEWNSLNNFVLSTIRLTNKWLGITTKIIDSSELQAKGKGTERILAICEELCATHYINPPNGRRLYKEEDFSNRGMILEFAKITAPVSTLEELCSITTVPAQIS